MMNELFGSLSLYPPSLEKKKKKKNWYDMVWYGMVWYGSLVGTTNDFDEASYHIDPHPYITLHCTSFSFQTKQFIQSV